MNIKYANYIISNTDVNRCPRHQKPEYAFIGRSNVGKSSLINMLTNKKDLAKTSAKPGKTLLINHFMINNEWYLVDLPGYGYAQAGKTQRERLRKMIESYALLREELTCMFVLIDSRHEPQQIDLDFMQFLGENGVPFAIIFTKSDKLGKETLQRNISTYKAKMSEQWEEMPPYFITSSITRLGANEILDYIESINRQVTNLK